jgi:hypothetical protein
MAPAGSSKNLAHLYTTPHTVAEILFFPYILSLKIDHLFKQKKKKKKKKKKTVFVTAATNSEESTLYLRLEQNIAQSVAIQPHV